MTHLLFKDICVTSDITQHTVEEYSIGMCHSVGGNRPFISGFKQVSTETNYTTYSCYFYIWSDFHFICRQVTSVFEDFFQKFKKLRYFACETPFLRCIFVVIVETPLLDASNACIFRTQLHIVTLSVVKTFIDFHQQTIKLYITFLRVCTD